MRVRELLKVLKFLREEKSCLILRHDLQLGMFGEPDDTMMKFHDRIMGINIKREFKNYPAEQCSRRRWNEQEGKWERAFGTCEICSYMCSARAKYFELMGKKEYIDNTTGLHYWA